MALYIEVMYLDFSQDSLFDSYFIGPYLRPVLISKINCNLNDRKIIKIPLQLSVALVKFSDIVWPGPNYNDTCWILVLFSCLIFTI